MAKIRLSKSPLGRPKSEIHKLASKIQDIIYLPNPDPLYVVLGSVVGNLLKGSPIWMVLIGASSSGKSTLLDMVHWNDKYKLPKTLEVDAVKSIGALLSGTSRKDISKAATGGLLRRVGNHGILVIKDLTVTLTAPREPLIEVIGAFRKIYDGSYIRDIGTDGGRYLAWYGKMGWVSGCTEVIDNYHSTTAILGPRWIYYRMDDDEGFGKSKFAMDNVDPDQRALSLFELVKEFFDNLNLDLGDEGMDRRKPDDLESNKMLSLGSFAVAARSPTERDWRTKELIRKYKTEGSSRFVSGLTQLYLGLEVIGLEAEERWRIIRKVALDSMPNIRLEIVKRLCKGAATPNELKMITEVSAGTVRIAAEDLGMHGVVENVLKGDRMGDRAGSWRLTQWGRKMLKQGGVI